MGRKKQQQSEAAFWQWFQDNAQQLHDAIKTNKANEALADILVSLHKIHPELACELGVHNDDTSELVISADGQRELFPTVLEIVEAAPAVPGWRIVPFRQPKGTHFKISYGDIILDPDAIQVRLLKEPDGRVGLELYSPVVTSNNYEEIEGVALLLLDAALGEYTVETQIGSVTCLPLVQAFEQPGLHSFHDLPRLINGWVLSA